MQVGDVSSLFPSVSLLKATQAVMLPFFFNGTVSSNVPQGFLLGVVLVNIFLHDLKKVVKRNSWAMLSPYG